MSPSLRRVVALLAVVAVTSGAGTLAGFLLGRRGPYAPVERLMTRLAGERPTTTTLPWRVTDTLPQPRHESGTVLIGEELYFLGGFATAELTSTTRVDVLHLGTGAWRRAADLPTGLTHANAVVLGDTVVWLAGGFDGDHPAPTTAATWRYDVARDRWEPGPPLPAPRGGGGLVAVGDTLHYFGGWHPDRNTDSRDHWRLVPGATMWAVRAPMRRPRGHFAVAPDSGGLRVIGGNIGHDPLPVDVPWIDRYDLATDSWVELPSLPLPRSHVEPGAPHWRDRLLMVGGRDLTLEEWQLVEVTSYAAASRRVRLEAMLPTALLAPAAVMVGDTLVVGGGAPVANVPSNRAVWRVPLVGAWHRFADAPAAVGRTAGGIVGDRLFLVGQGSRSTLSFNLATGRWDALDQWARRPGPGHSHSAEVLGDELWLVGALGFRTYAGTTQVFSPAMNLWRMGPPPPSRAGALATAVIGGQLYAVGGIAGSAVTGEAAVLDPALGSWRAIAPMPRPRFAAAAGTDGDRLFVFGGKARGGAAADAEVDVQIYDPTTDQWTVSDGTADAPLPMPEGRSGMGKAIFLDGQFYLIGGEGHTGAGATSTGTFASVTRYDPRANRWEDGPPLSVARHGITAVRDGDRIVVAGGGTVAGPSASALLGVLRPR